MSGECKPPINLNKPQGTRPNRTASPPPMLRTAIAAEARRRISLAPARFAHELAQAQAQAQTAVPERGGFDPSWAPLYRRISRLYGRPPGMVAAEMDNYLRKRRPLSADQIVAYVRKLRKFKSNEIGRAHV